jgi:GTPase
VFVDELVISVRGGKGGDGCVSFLREKYAQRGGPDGGEGGDGGAVLLLPSIHCNTLYALAGRKLFAAPNGEPGGPRNCGGRNAVDITLEVPVGTLVFDAGRDNLLADLTAGGKPFVIARGGRGGRGNSSFATATHRSPRDHELGMPGEERTVRLSLKLIADVGLVGLPNAGKSTLLAQLTRARPKIAGYPFTTLEPMLGIATGPGDTTYVLADIPGLIAGAHEGKGLGDKFLKHVERTRALLHLVDCSEFALADPVAAFHTIRGELRSYSPALAARPFLVLGTKVEDPASSARALALAEGIGLAVLPISAATGAGLRELGVAVSVLLRQVRDTSDGATAG